MKSGRGEGAPPPPPPTSLCIGDHCGFCSLSPLSCSRNWPERKRPHRLGTRGTRTRWWWRWGGEALTGHTLGQPRGRYPSKFWMGMCHLDLVLVTLTILDQTIRFFEPPLGFPSPPPPPPPHELVRKGEREPREVLSLAPTHFFPSPLHISSVVPQLEQTIYFKAVYPRAFSSKRGKFSHVTMSTIYRLIFLSSHACCWHN